MYYLRGKFYFYPDFPISELNQRRDEKFAKVTRLLEADPGFTSRTSEGHSLSRVGKEIEVDPQLCRQLTSQCDPLKLVSLT